MHPARASGLIHRNDSSAARGHEAIIMWQYYPDLLKTAVPRYTSYPTAAEFAALPADIYADALGAVHGDISLYVHIPFCEKICFYCGCNTGKAGNRRRLDSYLGALYREIDTVSDLLPSHVTARRIAFGGGSPNAIGATEFVALVEHLRARFRFENPVQSVELDPRTFPPDWPKAMEDVGIDRASLGVQTFAAHCQEAIGRVQPAPLIERSAKLLRRHGVTSLNFDLMYGLPHQTLDDLRESLELAVEMGPDRIALFGYAHVPHLIPRQRVIESDALPNPAERFAMAELGFELLQARGYRSIGFDHFAKPGDPLTEALDQGRLRRNFQGFTDDPASALIGLGSSAISGLPQLLAQNDKNSGRYRMLAGQGRLATSVGIVRTEEDQARGKMIEDFLCRGSAQLGTALDERTLVSLRPFLERDLAVLEGGFLSIRPGGLPYLRSIATVLDPHRRQSIRRFSSAV